MLSSLWDLASFIVTLGILTTVHGFGHFWVARHCSAHVGRSSIGFGKALWRRTGKLGTGYVITLTLLGNYVKILNERAGPVVPEFRHHAFNNKSVGQRMMITAAGPVANFIFAILAYWLVFIIDVPGVRPVVGEIAANSMAAEAQIAPGTELRTVDGIETPDQGAVRLQLVDKAGDGSATITVAPLGSDQRRNIEFDLRHWASEPDREDPVSSPRIRPRGPQTEPILKSVQPNSVVSKVGLQASDRVVKVDGQPLTQQVTFVILVRDNPGKSLALEVERQGSPLSLTLVPESKPGSGKATGFVSVGPKVIPLSDEYKAVHQYGPSSVIVEVMDKTQQLMKLTVSMLRKLITDDVKPNNLSGLVSIAKEAGMTAELGVIYYLPLLVLISVSLGITSLFPLLVSDGGRLLSLVIEKIKSGLVSEQVQDFCYRIGSILLTLLMGLALFNDFSRP